MLFNKVRVLKALNQENQMKLSNQTLIKICKLMLKNKKFYQKKYNNNRAYKVNLKYKVIVKGRLKIIIINN